MPTISKTELLRSLCKESFYDFVQQFWSTVVPEDPIWNWHIEILCIEMQEVMERIFQNKPKEYDLLINIPPGTTKSTVCSIMAPPWAWTRMPTSRWICGSYSDPLSMDLSRKSRMVVTSELYQQTFPEIKLADDQNSKHYFVNTLGGMRYSMGAGGTVTGFHAHGIIIDDPLNPKEAASEAELKNANVWMNETLPDRKVDKLNTPTILIMQRLHQDDPAGSMLKKAESGKYNVRHICLPAELKYEVKPTRLRTFYSKDGLLDEARLPRQVLDEAFVTHGEYGYAGQYGQNPIPPGGAMFKVERIKLDIPHVAFRQVVRYWDKAGTHKGGCFTAGVKMGIDINGQFWILNCIKGQWESHAREAVIRRTAEMDGRGCVIGIEQEPGSGGKESAEATVRRLAGFRVRVDRPTGDKVLRADAYSVQVNSGNVLVAQGEWVRDYIEELRYFPFGKYKDQVDASSGAFNLITAHKKVGGFSFLHKPTVGGIVNNRNVPVAVPN
jgi:predicted phage terminase large subunit-like protein